MSTLKERGAVKRRTMRHAPIVTQPPNSVDSVGARGGPGHVVVVRHRGDFVRGVSREVCRAPAVTSEPLIPPLDLAT